MGFVNSISLVGGWFPAGVWIVAVIGMLFLLLPRKQSKWLLRIAVMAIAAVLATLIAHWLLVWVFYVLPEPMPGSVIAWGCVGSFAVLLGILGLRGTEPWRRLATPLAVASVVLLSAVQVNAYFGQYVNIGSLYDADASGLPTLSRNDLRTPQELAKASNSKLPAIQGWNAPADMPKSGKFFENDIPGTVSGFSARNAVIYLPPAYLVAKRPQLPVLVMVAGQPGSPQRWIDAGDLGHIMNRFARSHHGLAPVVVVVDPNGSQDGNTMCMDSQIARAGTYLSVDVPKWIKTNLDVQTDTSRWAFGGFSFGGTCAIQLGTEHPAIYPNILDLSGQLEPALTANRTVTIKQSFGGDVAAFDARTPLALLGHNKYRNSFAYFSVGAADSHYGPQMDTLSAAAKAAGMTVVNAKVADVGHSWKAAKVGLADGLDVLANRMGLAR